MDQAQWTALVSILQQVARSFGRLKRQKYTDLMIAKLYFWAVWLERPMTFAVDPVHYNRLFRPRKVPSISQLNRRIASDRFQSFLQRLHEKLAATDAWGTICIDGRALEVAAHSRDRDAKWGHAPGGAGIGYARLSLSKSRSTRWSLRTGKSLFLRSSRSTVTRCPSPA